MKRRAPEIGEHDPWPVTSGEATTSEDGSAWVFGYGSLMWDPGFPIAEAAWGLVRGWHRALCILSVLNRGSRERPGLALGLARGGSCRGRALRVAADDIAACRSYLWRREMPNRAYVARLLPVRLDDGRRIEALAFVARRGHPQYVADLPPEEAAALVADAEGSYGRALDYLRNVVFHLDGFGIHDGPLHRILALAEAAHASDDKHMLTK
jgi:cation transport protein ChaC